MSKLQFIATLVLIFTISTLTLGQTNTEKPDAKKLKPRPVPTLQLENGVILSKADGYKRSQANTVCAGDRIAFQARLSGAPDVTDMIVKWTASSGQGISDDNGRYILDTTGLAPGNYTLTAEVSVPYKECEGNCTAYDTKSFVVRDCPACFITPAVKLSSDSRMITPGENVKICASQVSGGKSYGTLLPTWTSSAGRIEGDTNCARLDTTGVTPDSTIEVNYKLNASDIPECEAKGSITFRVAPPVLPTVVELTPCDTFTAKTARVDNYCKAILTDAIRQLEADPQGRLVIDSYYQEGESSNLAYLRGKNVRDRMADGSLGVAVDANRLIVRPSGKSSDGSQVKLFFLPAGAKLPAGAATADVGDVNKESRRNTNRRR